MHPDQNIQTVAGFLMLVCKVYCEIILGFSGVHLIAALEKRDTVLGEPV